MPPRTKEHIKNLSKAAKGRRFSDETKKKISEAHRGMRLSSETKKRISKANKGEKCSRWQGGITPLNLSVRNLYENRQWRDDVYARDSFLCRICAIKGEKLNAHHIKMFSVILKENNIKTLEEAVDCAELWDINNGITLCKKCHKKLHIKLSQLADIG